MSHNDPVDADDCTEYDSMSHNDPVDADDCTEYDSTPTFKFHEKNKGQGVTLSNNGRTAARTEGFCVGGIVLSCDPMEINHLYEVEINKTDTLWKNAFIYLGVVTESADSVVLPRWPLHPKPSVVVYCDWVMENGVKKSSKVGRSLGDMRSGQRVGLLVDHNGTLHLYKEGEHQGAVPTESHIPLPCHFMVDVGYCCRKVTARPIQQLM